MSSLIISAKKLNRAEIEPRQKARQALRVKRPEMACRHREVGQQYVKHLRVSQIPGLKTKKQRYHVAPDPIRTRAILPRDPKPSLILCFHRVKEPQAMH
jgi:hypothetical protein